MVSRPNASIAHRNVERQGIDAADVLAQGYGRHHPPGGSPAFMVASMMRTLA